jgi:hypothetical protein
MVIVVVVVRGMGGWVGDGTMRRGGEGTHPGALIPGRIRPGLDLHLALLRLSFVLDELSALNLQALDLALQPLLLLLHQLQLEWVGGVCTGRRRVKRLPAPAPPRRGTHGSVSLTTSWSSLTSAAASFSLAVRSVLRALRALLAAVVR